MYGETFYGRHTAQHQLQWSQSRLKVEIKNHPAQKRKEEEKKNKKKTTTTKKKPLFGSLITGYFLF